MSLLDPGPEKGPTLRRLGSDVSSTAGNRGMVRSMTVSSAWHLVTGTSRAHPERVELPRMLGC